METETTKKRTSADPTEGARDVIEKAAQAGRTYADAWNAAAVSGLRTAFDLQNEAIAAGQTVANATIDASRELAEDWTKAVRAGQADAVKLAEAGSKLVERAFDIR